MPNGTEVMLDHPRPGCSVTASFRDPAGRLVVTQDRVFRIVHSQSTADVAAILASPAVESLTEEGKLIGSRRLTDIALQETLADHQVNSLYCSSPHQWLLEHDRVPFPSFPYEWPPEMLCEAADLTLQLARRLLPESLGLKDASPYNVLFRGPEAVFIDLLSIEPRQPGDSTWLPYAQFVRTFLLPLLANKHFHFPLDQLFLTRRDGLQPEEVYRWAGPLRRCLPPFLTLVSLPAWLGRKHNQDDTAIYQRPDDTNPERSRFILEAILRGLQRQLNRLTPRSGKQSIWSNYLVSNNNYSEEHFEAKKRFVEDTLANFTPRRVLDVGCNTGFFSSIAARAGARVVAIDYDPVVVGETWRTARQHHLDILPLVVNLTRPTPGSGWRNSECPSFLDRARGNFDTLLMLAVIHHMLVTERIPLAEILSLAAELTTDLLIVEFVAPQDSMFIRLARGREELFRDLDNRSFEAAAQAHFEIARVEHVEGTHRWLYALRKKR